MSDKNTSDRGSNFGVKKLFILICLGILVTTIIFGVILYKNHLSKKEEDLSDNGIKNNVYNGKNEDGAKGTSIPLKKDKKQADSPSCSKKSENDIPADFPSLKSEKPQEKHSAATKSQEVIKNDTGGEIHSNIAKILKEEIQSSTKQEEMVQDYVGSKTHSTTKEKPQDVLISTKQQVDMDTEVHYNTKENLKNAAHLIKHQKEVVNNIDCKTLGIKTTKSIKEEDERAYETENNTSLKKHDKMNFNIKQQERILKDDMGSKTHSNTNSRTREDINLITTQQKEKVAKDDVSESHGNTSKILKDEQDFTPSEIDQENVNCKIHSNNSTNSKDELNFRPSEIEKESVDSQTHSKINENPQYELNFTSREIVKGAMSNKILKIASVNIKDQLDFTPKEQEKENVGNKILKITNKKPQQEMKLTPREQKKDEMSNKKHANISEGKQDEIKSTTKLHKYEVVNDDVVSEVLNKTDEILQDELELTPRVQEEDNMNGKTSINTCQSQNPKEVLNLATKHHKEKNTKDDVVSKIHSKTTEILQDKQELSTKKPEEELITGNLVSGKNINTIKHPRDVSNTTKQAENKVGETHNNTRKRSQGKQNITTNEQEGKNMNNGTLNISNEQSQDILDSPLEEQKDNEMISKKDDNTSQNHEEEENLTIKQHKNVVVHVNSNTETPITTNERLQDELELKAEQLNEKIHTNCLDSKPLSNTSEKRKDVRNIAKQQEDIDSRISNFTVKEKQNEIKLATKKHQDELFKDDLTNKYLSKTIEKSQKELKLTPRKQGEDDVKNETQRNPKDNIARNLQINTRKRLQVKQGLRTKEQEGKNMNNGTLNISNIQSQDILDLPPRKKEESDELYKKNSNTSVCKEDEMNSTTKHAEENDRNVDVKTLCIKTTERLHEKPKFNVQEVAEEEGDSTLENVSNFLDFPTAADLATKNNCNDKTISSPVLEDQDNIKNKKTTQPLSNVYSLSECCSMTSIDTPKQPSSALIPETLNVLSNDNIAKNTKEKIKSIAPIFDTNVKKKETAIFCPFERLSLQQLSVLKETKNSEDKKPIKYSKANSNTNLLHSIGNPEDLKLSNPIPDSSERKGKVDKSSFTHKKNEIKFDRQKRHAILLSSAIIKIIKDEKKKLIKKFLGNLTPSMEKIAPYAKCIDEKINVFSREIDNLSQQKSLEIATKIALEKIQELSDSMRHEVLEKFAKERNLEKNISIYIEMSILHSSSMQPLSINNTYRNVEFHYMNALSILHFFQKTNDLEELFLYVTYTLHLQIKSNLNLNNYVAKKKKESNIKNFINEPTKGKVEYLNLRREIIKFEQIINFITNELHKTRFVLIPTESERITLSLLIMLVANYYKYECDPEVIKKLLQDKNVEIQNINITKAHEDEKNNLKSIKHDNQNNLYDLLYNFVMKNKDTFLENINYLECSTLKEKFLFHKFIKFVCFFDPNAKKNKQICDALKKYCNIHQDIDYSDITPSTLRALKSNFTKVLTVLQRLYYNLNMISFDDRVEKKKMINEIFNEILPDLGKRLNEYFTSILKAREELKKQE